MLHFVNPPPSTHTNVCPFSMIAVRLELVPANMRTKYLLYHDQLEAFWNTLKYSSIVQNICNA